MTDFKLGNQNVLAEPVFEATVETLAVGGAGVVRRSSDQLVVFVPFSAPGDRLRIEITHVKSNHAWGRIQEILSAGPGRIKPPCIYYGECGGCDWQHLDLETQQKIKVENLKNTLARFLPGTRLDVKPLRAGNSPWNYRNRVKVHSDGSGRFGYYRQFSRDLVDVSTCLLLEDRVNQELADLRNQPPKVRRPKSPTKKPQSEKLRDHFLGGSGEFSQVNSTVNQLLVDRTLEILNEHKPERLLELFAGSGNFTFPILERVRPKQILGVELDATAAARAQKRVADLNLSPYQLSFFCADVEVFLKTFSPKDWEPKRFTVLLDPPRAGASKKTMEYLRRLGAKNFVYISCNPVTLGRDLQVLGAPKVLTLEPFEMFPQTSHLETLAHFQLD